MIRHSSFRFMLPRTFQNRQKSDADSRRICRIQHRFALYGVLPKELSLASWSAGGSVSVFERLRSCLWGIATALYGAPDPATLQRIAGGLCMPGVNSVRSSIFPFSAKTAPGCQRRPHFGTDSRCGLAKHHSDRNRHTLENGCGYRVPFA